MRIIEITEIELEHVLTKKNHLLGVHGSYFKYF